MPQTTICYVGLGSNLDGPAAQVRLALAELDRLEQTTLLARSSLYRSPPLGPPDQPDYINAVAKLATRLSADVLLDKLLSIEQDHGRFRGDTKWGPRTLDLDLLLYGDEIRNERRLTLPHPGISQRVFVLAPLFEIEPALVIPGHGAVAHLLQRFSDAPIEKLGQNEEDWSPKDA